jgi:hypothetical protein
LGNKDIIALLRREDHAALTDLARLRGSKVLRYLTGRLYSEDQEEKWRAVRALGAIVADRRVLGRAKAADLLQRYFWSLNDESGAVPFGVPEAIGEILAARPELQVDFLSPLCAMITHEDFLQTGPIERGVIWALGRIGEPVVHCSAHAVQGIAVAAEKHPDPDTKRVAAWSLARIQGAAGQAEDEPGSRDGNRAANT